MKKFIISVPEVWINSFEVTAENKKEAEKKLEQFYYNLVFSLDIEAKEEMFTLKKKGKVKDWTIYRLD